MVRSLDYLTCVFCGKTSPATVASYKKGDPAEMGKISTRVCSGRKGFKKISEKNLREVMHEYPELCNQLFDMSSGILMIFLEEELDKLGLHKPVFIIKFQEMQNKIVDAEKENDNLRFELDDANKTMKVLNKEIERWKAYRDDISPAFDDLQRENRRLKEQLQGEINKSEGYGFWVDDKSREIQQLKTENARLRSIIKRYENTSLQ